MYLTLLFVLFVLPLSLGEVQVRTSKNGISRFISTGNGAWYNIEDASCDVTFSAVSLVWGAGNSEALDMFNFSFSIPTGATITSIRTTWTVSVDNKPPGTISESDIHLIYKTNNYPSTLRVGPSWDVAEMNITYPFGDQLWGKQNWTAEEINDPSFGVSLVVTSSAGDILFAVKCIIIEVNYTGGEKTVTSSITEELEESTSENVSSNLFELPLVAQYVLFSAMATLILILACGTAWFLMTMGSRRRASMSISPASLEGIGAGPIDEKLVKITGVSIKDEIGRGNFGSVYHGLWKNTEVACKSIADKLISEQILDEAGMLQRLRHPHVVQFYGVYKEDGNVFMVMEYLRKGDLLNYLRDRKPRVANLVSLTLSCASGCAYIASQGVLHRDIAARNVLVTEQDSEIIVKISDVGLARSIKSSEYVSTKSNSTPVRWSAPESLKDRIYTFKSDVWSLGVLIWEIFSHGKTPYKEIRDNPKVYDKVVNQRVYLDRPDMCPHNVYAVLMTCWSYNPQDRPQAEDVHAALIENTHSIGMKIPNENVYLSDSDDSEEEDMYNNESFGRGGGKGE